MATEATITIAVKPATSHLPGTVGWVQQQLRQVQLEVRATSGLNGRQIPVMLYGIGCKPISRLAFVGQPKQFGLANPDSDRYVVYSSSTALVADRVYAVDTDTTAGKEGMFDYLTPAGRKVVDAFLDEAVAAFRAALDHDDEVAELSFRVEFSAAA